MTTHLSSYIPPRLRILGVCVSIALGTLCTVHAEDIQFNTDVLDLKDRENIDLSQFAQRGFIMPGTYTMAIQLNKQTLSEQPVTFYTTKDAPKSSQVCLTPELVKQLGLKAEVESALIWQNQNECLDLSSLKGMEARGDLGASVLYLSVPQAYLEYSSTDWDPPSRWDEGIPGLLFDYNVNAQTNRQQNTGSSGYNVSGNGTSGANMGAWRLRADWQANLTHTTGSGEEGQKNWDWSRYYAYRAIPRMKAKLTVGEDYLTGKVFDSFRFTGASLVSDDNMLPPNLRGYAPEVTGVARTNAKVIISQQGRVLYETQVAAGPFRIQDISEAVTGQLDVRVEELDGSVQTFQVDTANLPYLTRPGQVRYNLAAGKPSSWGHHSDGPLFATGDFSWGINNGWSLIGGAIAGGDYNAIAAGLGRDLLAFGAISADVTQSYARLKNNNNETGRSYRVSYSKRFDELDSQVSFAGYRFSESGYMNMSEYLDVLRTGASTSNSKEMYTIQFNKQFRDLGLSMFINYNHQTYWNRPANDRYNLSMTRYFNLGSFRNMSVSLNAYRSKFNNTNDNGMYLSFSLPWGDNSTVSYNSSYASSGNSHNVSYFDRIDDHNNYQLSAGSTGDGAVTSGFVTHQGDLAQVNANASYRDGQYSSVGLSVQGGATATAKGAALHRTNMMGGTRMMLDTDGVSGVPVRGYGNTVDSNFMGTAVVADVNSYYRNSASIDLDNLADNAEARNSVVQGTLTEGAIGYRHFDVISGAKAMAIIRLADGTTPPFGATVLNNKKQETGIVNDEGSVYLSGIKAGERMAVRWNDAVQCYVTLPSPLPSSQLNNLLLPCE